MSTPSHFRKSLSILSAEQDQDTSFDKEVSSDGQIKIKSQKTARHSSFRIIDQLNQKASQTQYQQEKNFSSYKKNAASEVNQQIQLESEVNIEPQIAIQETLNEEKSFQRFMQIVNKDPSNRSIVESKQLYKNLKRVRFFEDLEKNHGIQTVYQCCQYLRFKEIQTGQILFQQGDIGEEFYIIIQGSVSVLVSSYEQAMDEADVPQADLRKKVLNQSKVNQKLDQSSQNNKFQKNSNLKEVSPNHYLEKKKSGILKNQQDPQGFSQLNQLQQDSVIKDSQSDQNQSLQKQKSQSPQHIRERQTSVPQSKLAQFQKISSKIISANRSQKINQLNIQSSPLILSQPLPQNKQIQDLRHNNTSKQILSKDTKTSGLSKSVQQNKDNQQQNEFNNDGVKFSSSNSNETVFIQREIKVLKKGDSFGELSLLKGKNTPRAATIKAKELTYLVFIVKQDFLNVLKDKETQKIQHNINFFSKIALFSGLEDNFMKQIYYNSYIKEYQRGQIVFKQGQESDAFYIVKEGEFSLFKNQCIHQKELTNKDNEQQFPFSFCKQQVKQNKLMKIAIVSAGFVFGFEEILLRVSRKYSIQCESSLGILIVMNSNEFYRKVYSYSKVVSERFKKQIQINENFNEFQEVKQNQICQQFKSYIMAEPTNKKILSLKKQLNDLLISSQPQVSVFKKSDQNKADNFYTTKLNQIFENRKNLEGTYKNIQESQQDIKDHVNYRSISCFTDVLNSPKCQNQIFYSKNQSTHYNFNQFQPFQYNLNEKNQKFPPLEKSISQKSFHVSIQQNNERYESSPKENSTALSMSGYGFNNSFNHQKQQDNFILQFNDQPTDQDQIIEQSQFYEKSYYKDQFPNQLNNMEKANNQNQNENQTIKKQEMDLNQMFFIQPNYKKNIKQLKSQKNYFSLNSSQITIDQVQTGQNSMTTLFNQHPLLQLKQKQQSFQSNSQDINLNETQFIQNIYQRCKIDTTKNRKSQSLNNTTQKIQTQPIKENQNFYQSHIKLFINDFNNQKRRNQFLSISKEEKPIQKNNIDLLNLDRNLTQEDKNYELFERKKQELESLLRQKEENKKIITEETYQDKQNKLIFGHYHQLKRKHQQFQFFESLQQKVNQKSKLNKSEILNVFFSNMQKNQEVYNKSKKKNEKWRFSKYYDFILNPSKYAEKIAKKLSNNTNS
ncbi:cyclic nucleotide-binding domain protein (macronuclear) [Tetrahymena thermophila SB210]|uniref:Cyclic nucleotide-binding domain protein n=1 Tax=Tetrahymena thermophila (strain SB210) TaxID=312017 RepID=Q24D40_TETTS|nr:cyclic nucleotide-binding domain protein [Tetrahymena thermophila SB210]EAS05701.2 cyclic nucleotide-binding domain protein [Tetrahymena thermophila SB210]|eukprot:XP_001025946.2 cyclic nucleotide-binding domain protein [Tetrahymena thermophila SB210]